jgi:spoIIIJ-associated protein
MPWITKEGRTVEEATDAAIAQSGLPVDELDIEVVNAGAKGLFGLGGEPAVVRVRPKNEATDVRHAFRDDITPHGDESTAPARERPPVDDEEDDEADDEDKRSLAERQEGAMQLGVEIVRGILERLELEGDVRPRVAGGTVYIEVFGDEMGILIGRSGTTLEALQELVRAGIQRRLKTRQAVVVDVEAYWERRRKPQQGRDRGERGERGGRGGGQRRGGRGRGRGERGNRDDGNRDDGNRDDGNR